MRWIAALFIVLCQLTAALAQQQILVPTRPAGDNTNAAASTAFVQARAPLNIMAFGGDPTFTNDNATPINNALAAASATQRCVFFPSGHYKINTAINFNIPAGIVPVCLIGDAMDASILTWPNASGGMTFNYNGSCINSSVHVRDLSGTTGTTNGGTFITLNCASLVSNPAVFAQSDLYRVGCRGDDGYAVTNYWTVCVAIANVSNVNIEANSYYGASSPNGTGITLVGLPGSSGFGTVYNFSKGIMNNLTTCYQYGSFIQGVTIDQTNCTGFGSFGVSVPAGQTGTLDQLVVSNGQFNGAAGTVAAINLLTAVNHVFINDDLFFLKANHTALNVVNGASVVVNGNSCAGSSLTATTCYQLAGTTGLGVVNDNVANGVATGISIGTNVVTTTVNSNTLSSNTTNVTNASTATSNSGSDLPPVTFTATPSCSSGSGTWATNSAQWKRIGGLVYVSLDVSLTAVGTCTTGNWQFNLPFTAISVAGYSGVEIGVTGNIVGCSTRSGSLTLAGCVLQGASLATNDRFNVSGTFLAQ